MRHLQCTKMVYFLIAAAALLPLASCGEGEQSTGAANAATPEQIKWDTKEVDATKNGNLNIAADFLNAAKTETLKKLYVDAAPSTVAKAPWKYYGKLILVKGDVGVIQEYPPGSDLSKAIAQGGEVAEIHMVSDDGTSVGILLIGTTGDLKEGDTYSKRVIPVGIIENENKLGGKISELFTVGKVIK